MKESTTSPARAGDTDGAPPEFGRLRDVQGLFGLTRGMVHSLLKAHKIHGALLRVKGQRSGAGLLDVNSVRALLSSEMAYVKKASDWQ